MSFIRLAAACIALCASAAVASAQGGPPPGAPPQGGPGGAGGPEGARGMRGMSLTEGIALTEVQQAKLDSIQTFYGAERKKLVASEQAAGTPGEAIRGKVMELSNKMTAEIRTVLTADQQKLYDANVEKRKQMMQQRGR